jgi:AraC-like DNA-binding protein
VARIIRFERVIDLLRAGVPLADTAYSCGYADQPHLNRDFREFAQSTPADWLRRQLPGQSGTGA